MIGYDTPYERVSKLLKKDMNYIKNTRIREHMANYNVQVLQNIGILNRIDAYGKVYGERTAIEMAKKTLDEDSKSITYERIIEDAKMVIDILNSVSDLAGRYENINCSNGEDLPRNMVELNKELMKIHLSVIDSLRKVSTEELKEILVEIEREFGQIYNKVSNSNEIAKKLTEINMHAMEGFSRFANDLYLGDK